MEAPRSGKEWDAQVLAETTVEETVEDSTSGGVNWLIIVIAILCLVFIGTAIAMIGQFHLYEIFAGRKT